MARSPLTPKAAGEERPQAQESIRSRIRGFVTSTKGFVITFVAVLAGIVSIVLGVRALLAGSPALTVNFERLKVDDDVSLEEFDNLAEARIAAQTPTSSTHPSVPLAAPNRLARAVIGNGSSPVNALAITEDKASETVTTEVATTQDTTAEDKTTSTHSTNSTLAIPAPATPLAPVSGVPTREGTGAASKQVHKVAAALTTIRLPRRSVKLALPAKCASSICPATTPLIDDELAYHSDPAVAARNVARAFADSRGLVMGHKLYPIGAAVSYTIDLVGFAHNEAILVWSLWPAGGQRPLPKTWLRNVIAKEVTPLRENETFSGLFWVPLPPRRGAYEVHLTLYTSDHVEHGEMETEPPFH
jgi:hypothetical protein